MSEFTVAPGATTFATLGLEIINDEDVTVRTPFNPKPVSPENTIVVEGSNGADVITTSKKFIYDISGGKGKDVITDGSKLNDGSILDGGANKDIIDAGKGNDLVIGGEGLDTVTGGKGKDTFEFAEGDLTKSDKKLDIIEDFDPGKDTISLSKKLLPKSGLKKGELPEDEFESVKKNKGNKAEKIDAAIIYDEKSGIIYYNSDQNGTKDDPLIQVDPGLNMSSGDFEIF